MTQTYIAFKKKIYFFEGDPRTMIQEEAKRFKKEDAFYAWQCTIIFDEVN